LVDAGQLTLGDHLESYVPGIPNGDQITIEQLLGMTAGIYNYVEDPAFESAYSADPLLPFTPDDALAIISQHPPDFAPGERLNYSDSNYVLLGLIIEQLTGQSVGEAITAGVIEPLGLAGTSYPTTPEMPDPYTRGYASDPERSGLRDVTRSDPAVAGPAGAMISTLADLRIWTTALAEGSLLSPEMQRERLRWIHVPGRDFDLGYGLGIMELNGFMGHNGSIFGYSTWMMHLPDDDATIVVLTNRAETQTETARGIFLDIVTFLFPERFPRPAATPVGTPVP
jgi:D-alanyl-D-alanine carboxypeptidase